MPESQRVKSGPKLELVDIAPLAGPSYPPVQQHLKLQPPFDTRHHEGPHRGVNVDGKSLGEIADRLDRLDLKKANLNHRIYQVSKPGQKVPGVMQPNSESRREGMLVFEKRYINNHPRADPYAENDERPWTWYNPYKDIIFFGEDTCIRTAVDFFRYNSNEKYAKVAFHCANIVGTCKCRCNYDTWEYPHGDDISLCIEGYGMGGGGVGIMQVLQGVDEAIALNNLVPGAPAVEKVFFVVKTERMKFEAGAMPSNLKFRPLIHNGLTTCQEKMKISYQKMINQDRSGERFDGFAPH
ncbi:hypothetical protein DID88_004716 [Monilinia fructigena]|uniref:Uncharacterized protein n=1 Tax=Monilinia fructigena TaxID=38457 RepID=A0A395IRB9_9HELO|nr:hypothetical protein DID88_004716 [Monilinia fructigena]